MKLFKCLLSLLCMAFLVIGCQSKESTGKVEPEEDLQAKKLFQGVWMDADEGLPSFKVEGDSIFYPDSTSIPATFKIIGDTLIIQGVGNVKYPIVKQTEHIFEFKNQNGENVRLEKSDDSEVEDAFEQERPVALNQNKVIKRDSVVMLGDMRYHCYVQVNPTTYKVIRSTYNNDGVEVGNVYFDNTIHVAIFQGRNRVYSHDFKKSDFSQKVPKDFLQQSVLSDMELKKIDTDGFHYMAQICMPDSPSSYIVEVIISKEGKVTMKVG